MDLARWLLTVLVFGLGLFAALAPATYVRVMPDFRRGRSAETPNRQIRVGGVAMLMIAALLVLKLSGTWPKPQPHHPVSAITAELIGATCGMALLAFAILFIGKTDAVTAWSNRPAPHWLRWFSGSPVQQRTDPRFVRWFGVFLLAASLAILGLVLAMIVTS